MPTQEILICVLLLVVVPTATYSMYKFCTLLPMFNTIVFGEGHILIIFVMICIYNEKLTCDLPNIYD